MRSKIFWKFFGLFFGAMALNFLLCYLYLLPYLRNWAYPFDLLRQADVELKKSFLLAGASGLFVAGIVGFFFFRSLSRSIREMVEASSQISEGDFSQKIFSHRTDELGRLSRTINRMADNLARQRSDLLQEKRQLQAVLDSMVEGVLVTDANGVIVLANPAFQSIAQFNRDLRFQTILESLRNEPIHTLVQQVLEGAGEQQAEIVLFINGEEKRLLGHAAPLMNQQVIEGAVAVFHDITALRNLENVRKEFVANVSHELKTPLTNIRGYAETLLNGALDSPEMAKKFVVKISEHALILQALVEDILKLSEIESGRVELKKEPMDVALFAQELFDRFQPSFLEKKIQLHLILPKTPTKLLSDKMALSSILSNLIDNALRYTDSGGEVIIEVLSQPENRCLFSVKDTGVGIAEPDRKRIFERFYRVDKSRTRHSGGTGLGLSIVKHLVLLLGGEIHLESEIGKGSKFNVIIPA